MMKARTLARAALLASFVLIAPASVQANHAWSDYHWSVSAYPFNIPTGSNVTGAWSSYLDGAIADWTLSQKLDLSRVSGQANPRTCKPVAGTVQVCNAKYGFNGWLGIAQIWLTTGDHITQGVTKLNDSYFATKTYNTPDWRALVTCQEIGHTLGLTHQDENFSNADVVDSNGVQTCMDYTNVPAGNRHPNAHDYDELDNVIYAHAHTNFGVRTLSPESNAAPRSEAAGGDTPASWGRAIHTTADGRPDVFLKITDTGRKMITHVFWVGAGSKR